MLDRREFVVALCATGLLSACQSGPPKPSSVVLNFAGGKGTNPGPDGSDRPVTVMIYRLRSTGKFNSADYFALTQTIFGHWLSKLVLFGFTWALLHHMLGGLRHLLWDTGHGFKLTTVEWLARLNIALSILLTLALWIGVYLMRGTL